MTGIISERATCTHLHHLILPELTSPRHVLISKSESSKVLASSRGSFI
jgi:hypothetical protein